MQISSKPLYDHANISIQSGSKLCQLFRNTCGYKLDATPLVPDPVVLIIVLVYCKCREHFMGCILSSFLFNTPVHTQIILTPTLTHSLAHSLPLPISLSLSLCLSYHLSSYATCVYTSTIFTATEPCGGLGAPLSTSAGLVNCSATNSCPTMHFCHSTNFFGVCCPGTL